MSFARAGIIRSPGLALATIAVVEMWVRSTSLFAAHSALSLSCVLLAIWHALAGRATDLVEGRRRLRVVFAVATALYTMLIVASDWLWPGGLSVASLSLANAAGLMTFIFLFAVLESLPSTAQPLVRTATPAGPPQSLASDPRAAAPPAGPDAALLAALRRLIDHDKVYREPDLSIASLSQKLDIPEYRLRRLINEQLGHRNFSAFVNGYRLAEAETALRDPRQAAVPVLTIALDAGFGSIGPFNRAFKAHTGSDADGVSPRPPRRHARRRASPIPHLTGRFQESASLAREIGERRSFTCATFDFGGQGPAMRRFANDAADRGAAIRPSRRDRRSPRWRASSWPW